MADESKLVISVDSRSVPQATAQLDALTAASARTETAAKSLGETETEAQARIRAMVRSSLAAVDAERARAAASRSSGAAVRVASEASATATKSSAELAAAQTAAMGATTRLLAATEAQSVAIKRSSADQLLLDTVMKGSLKTSVAMDAAETKLHQAYTRGALSAAELTAALKVLDKQREKDALLATLQGKAEGTHGKGINARVGVEGVRVIGDLATGNTRRAQMSGLAAANYSGLTGKLIGAIATPVGAAATAGVAALALLTAAFVANEKEAAAYNKALSGVGQVGVTTASQLRDMAQSIGSGSGQFGMARDIVTGLVKDGQAISPMFQQAAQAAMTFAQATGSDAATAVKTVNDLMSGSFASISKVDQAYQFLTSAQREHIRALADQGDAQGAATAALQAFADKSAQVKDQAEQDASAIENAWHGVTGAIGGAWNTLKQGVNNGVVDLFGGNVSEEYDKSLRQLTSLQDRASLFEIKSNPKAAAAYAKMIADQQAKVDTLRAAYNKLTDAQKKQTVADEQDKAAKAGEDYFAAHLSPIRQYANEMERALKAKNAILANPRSTQGQKDDATQAYNARTAELQAGLVSRLNRGQPKVRAGSKADPLASMQSMIDGMRESAQRAEGPVGEFIATTMKLTTARDAAIKKGADAGEAERLFAEGIAIANQRLKEQEQQLQNRTKVAMQQFTASLQQQMDVQRQQNDLSIASIGMGTQQAQREQQLLQIRQATAAQLFQMQQEAQSNIAQIDPNAAGAQEQIKQIQDTLAKQKAEYQAYGDWQIAEAQRVYAGQDAAMGSWANGFRTTYQDLLAQSKDFASVAGKEMQDFANTTTNALVGLAKGTMSLKDAFDSVIQAMLTDALQFLANQAVVKFLSLFQPGGAPAGGFNLSGMPSSFGGSGSIDWGSVATSVASWFSANGNAFGPRGPIPFANGTVVGSPTLFRFAGGIGMMGEAGPEAIMPLKRGRDGKLGVAAPAQPQKGGRAPRSTTINVNVQPTSTRQTAVQIAREVAHNQQLAIARF